jgi:hypothetical protein
MATPRSTGPKTSTHVPLAPGPVERRDPLLRHGHDRFTPGLLAGRLVGQLVARTPVHVGTGTVERTARLAPALAAETPLVWPLTRAAGIPVVPGPTLKGAVRSLVEAIAPACLGMRQRAPALPPALHALETCRRYPGRPAELCVACRLFGALGYQGRVHFADAPLQEGVTTLAMARPLHGALPARAAVPRGRKLYRHGQPAQGSIPLEACAPGAVFPMRLDFSNLLPAELGLLLVALGQGEPPLALKLGGYKPSCFGSVQVEQLYLALDEPDTRYLTYTPVDAEPPPSVFDPAPYLQSLAESGLLLTDRLRQVAEVLSYPGYGDCAAGSA